MTDEQFERHALEVLRRELGVEGLARFLRLHRSGPVEAIGFDLRRGCHGGDLLFCSNVKTATGGFQVQGTCKRVTAGGKEIGKSLSCRAAPKLRRATDH